MYRPTEECEIKEDVFEDREMSPQRINKTEGTTKFEAYFSARASYAAKERATPSYETISKLK